MCFSETPVSIGYPRAQSWDAPLLYIKAKSSLNVYQPCHHNIHYGLLLALWQIKYLTFFSPDFAELQFWLKVILRNKHLASMLTRASSNLSKIARNMSSSASTFRAVMCEKLQPPPPFAKDSLPVRELPALKPGKGEVLLSVKAAAGKFRFFVRCLCLIIMHSHAEKVRQAHFLWMSCDVEYEGKST